MTSQMADSSVHIISNPGPYASSDGYKDPNIAFDVRPVDLSAGDMYPNSYADLIQQLARAELDPPETRSNSLTPSLNEDSNRPSSSEEHEARTPPDNGRSSLEYRRFEHTAPTPAKANGHGYVLSQQRAELQDLLANYRVGEHDRVGSGYTSQLAQERRPSAPASSSSTPDRIRSPPRPTLSLANSRSASMSSSTAGSSGSEKPFTRLGMSDIVFRATSLPERRLTPDDCREIITAKFPSLCDPPARQFDEDGKPLPPTKRDEATPEERQARKKALTMHFRGKAPVSIVKAMIVMESRSGSWKRLGPASSSQQVSSTLPEMPSPWTMDIYHQDLDLSGIKAKSKRTVEIANCRTEAVCANCEGRCHESCSSCKGETADECFWCAGKGWAKGKGQCHRCHGEGILKCAACAGKLLATCKTCQGTGSGEFGYFVEVKVKRVEMPSVRVSELVATPNPSSESVRSAAVLTLWDSIQRLTEASVGKPKPYIPVMAACVWETSVSHIIEADVPLAARFKKGSSTPLKPEGLHRRIPTSKRWFTIPSDLDLAPVELAESDLGNIFSSHPAPVRSSPLAQQTNQGLAPGMPRKQRSYGNLVSKLTPHRGSI